MSRRLSAERGHRKRRKVVQLVFVGTNSQASPFYVEVHLVGAPSAGIVHAFREFEGSCIQVVSFWV